MKKITIILAIAIGTAGIAEAQDKSMTSDQAAMMKKWEAYMTPGDVHAMLAKSNGDWIQDITMWMDPAAPPTKNKGTSTSTMILGGRYQQTLHKGTFDGMPFEGISTVGYDNAKKMMMSTYLEGKYDPATKTVTSTGTCVDPMTGKDMGVREVFTINDDNHQTMTMYMTPKGGKEYKSMEIKSTRK